MLIRSSQRYDRDTSNKVGGEKNYKLISSQRCLHFVRSPCESRFIMLTFMGMHKTSRIRLFGNRVALLYLCRIDLGHIPTDGRMHTKSHVLISRLRLLQVCFSASVRSGYLYRKQSSLAMYEAVERGSPNTTDYRVYFSEL